MAGQDGYGKNELNPSVDHNVNQYGYRVTVRYRESNDRYVPTSSYSIAPRAYGAAIEASRFTDHFEWTFDVYHQIPSYQILDDLNGKSLYIFTSETLVDKIDEVAFRVNDWELFNVKADRLVFQVDKPIAPWFLPLSAEEDSVRWKSVDVRYDGPPLPPQYKDDKGDVGWTWSLDFDMLRPRRIPEPQLSVDPFKSH